MNFIYTICVSLALLSGLQALDLHTDPSYAQLKTAIQEAQQLEKVQDAWNTIANSENASVQDKVQLATQVTAYAQEHKETLESQIAQLRIKAYDRSRLIKGIIKTEFGKWCALGFIYTFCIIDKDRPMDSRWKKILLTDIDLLCSMCGDPKNYSLIPTCLLVTFIIARPLLAAWSIHSGIEDIAEALTYRSTIEIKIKNLTAAIEFMQQLRNQ